MSSAILEYPVYDTIFVDKNHFVVGGGGGHEIPNVIAVFNTNLDVMLCESLEEAILDLDYYAKKGILVVCELRKFSLYRLVKGEKWKLECLFSKELQSNPYPDAETKVCAFKKKGKLLMSVCNDDNNIEIFEIIFEGKSFASCERISILKGHTGSVLSLKFSNFGDYLLSSSRDDSSILWDLKTFDMKKRFLNPKKAAGSKVLSMEHLKTRSFAMFHTSRKGGSYVSVFSKSFKLVKSYKIATMAMTCVSSIKPNGVFSVGLKQEKLFVCQLSPFKVIASKKVNGTFALTCCGNSPLDIKANEINVVTGSIQRQLNVERFSLDAGFPYMLLLFLLVCAIGILVFTNQNFGEPPTLIIVTFALSMLSMLIIRYYT